MATNAQAIREAIDDAVGELLASRSIEYRQTIARVALDCVGDEMDHAERMIPINLRLEERLNEVPTEGAEGPE